MTGARPRRHDLLRVAPDGWDAALAALPRPQGLPPAAAALLNGWARRGWPVVLRRRGHGDPPGTLPVGVPLPPSVGKLRVAAALPPGVPWQALPAPGLDTVRPAVPVAWHALLDRLAALGTGHGAPPRPYGAALWGALTGLPYLGPGSDLDLLWPVTQATALDGLLDGLARIAAGSPVPLDGEVLLPDGAGVNWRELHRARRGAAGEVLAKTADGISLRRALAPFAA